MLIQLEREQMIRDIELERRILFKIEEEYKAGQGSMFGLDIDGYEQATIAEHCDLLDQQGLIKSYKAYYGGDEIQGFHIGNLTAHGYDYLELIRNDEIWEKTKTKIEEEKLPKTVEVIAKIAGVFMGNFMKEFHG
jgi:hypothetical protein